MCPWECLSVDCAYGNVSLIPMHRCIPLCSERRVRRPGVAGVTARLPAASALVMLMRGGTENKTSNQNRVKLCTLRTLSPECRGVPSAALRLAVCEFSQAGIIKPHCIAGRTWEGPQASDLVLHSGSSGSGDGRGNGSGVVVGSCRDDPGCLGLNDGRGGIGRIRCTRPTEQCETLREFWALVFAGLFAPWRTRSSLGS